MRSRKGLGDGTLREASWNGYVHLVVCIKTSIGFCPSFYVTYHVVIYLSWLLKSFTVPLNLVRGWKVGDSAGSMRLSLTPVSPLSLFLNLIIYLIIHLLFPVKYLAHFNMLHIWLIPMWPCFFPIFIDTQMQFKKILCCKIGFLDGFLHMWFNGF